LFKSHGTIVVGRIAPHRSYFCGGRPASACLREGVKLCDGADRQNFDAAIGAIANPTTHAKPPRRLDRPPAKSDTLDVTLYDQPNRRLARHSCVNSRMI
jgi:hypothetical protein